MICTVHFVEKMDTELKHVGRVTVDRLLLSRVAEGLLVNKIEDVVGLVAVKRQTTRLKK